MEYDGMYAKGYITKYTPYPTRYYTPPVETESPTGCTVDEDCPPGQICVDGVCVDAPVSDANTCLIAYATNPNTVFLEQDEEVWISAGPVSVGIVLQVLFIGPVDYEIELYMSDGPCNGQEVIYGPQGFSGNSGEGIDVNVSGTFTQLFINIKNIGVGNTITYSWVQVEP